MTKFPNQSSRRWSLEWKIGPSGLGQWCVVGDGSSEQHEFLEVVEVSALTKAEAEIERLRKIIGKQLESEDGLGYEYTYVSILSQERDELRKELEDFKNGVQTYKCPHCHQCAAPFYRIDLNSEIAALKGDISEQARLLGISGSVEARLLAENKELNKQLSELVESVEMGAFHHTACNSNWYAEGTIRKGWDGKGDGREAKPCTCAHFKIDLVLDKIKGRESLSTTRNRG